MYFPEGLENTPFNHNGAELFLKSRKNFEIENEFALISLINVESTLTDFEKFQPPQKEIHPPLQIFLTVILSHKTLL